MAISQQEIVAWVKDYASVIEQNEDLLTDLDRQIGDADHGANMQRGFKAVLAKLTSVEDKDIATVLKTVGMTLLSTVGGAGGPLYSTLFIQMSKSFAGKEELGLSDWKDGLKAAFAGITNLGKAQPGDKTMLDALNPAIKSLEEANQQGINLTEALQKAAEAAHAGMLATIPLVAHKGRASYLGERSAGHQDPGATSLTFLLESAARNLAKA